MNEAIEPLNPIAFQLGPLAVHWYGIIIGLGALLGLWIAMRESEKRGCRKIRLLILSCLPFQLRLFAHEFITLPLNGTIMRHIREKSLRSGRAALPFMAD